ncbi:MAG: SEC-C metal-binding domain-containing protein [Anaerolineae bacterium]
MPSKSRARALARAIETATTAEDLVGLLVRVGKKLPKRLEEKIIELGADTHQPLTDTLTNEDLQMGEGPGSGWAPIHAADLLGTMKVEAAIEPLLTVLEDMDFDAILYNNVLFALEKIGPVALEPALAAFERADNPNCRTALCELLSKLSVKDERIFQALVVHNEDNPGYAYMLAEYGDPRGLDYLSRALDEYEVFEDESPFAHQDVIELVDGIEQLGGSLSTVQQRKYEAVIRMRERRRQEMVDRLGYEEDEPARRRKIGRNEPCPCGSGQKYKRCCGAPTTQGH